MSKESPKLFISYSWTSDELKQKVENLARQLVHDGIDVIIDIWDLREGIDKYAFMEQSVTSKEVDKVLIICDKKYMEKANERKGGVGDETTIISSEIYGKAIQTKFIPIVVEFNENNEPYLPAYLKSRMYIVLTDDNYSEGYERLLRNIYDKPEKRRPKKGSRPSWLDEDEPNDLIELKESNKNDFIDNYIEVLKPFFKDRYTTPQEYLEDFRKTKEYRNIFLDKLNKFSHEIDNIGLFMAEGFEKMYNILNDIHTFRSNVNQYDLEQFDLFKLHIWELFLCTTTYLLHYKKYNDLRELLYHTYFIKEYPASFKEEAFNYTIFRFYSNCMENWVKRSDSNFIRYYTLVGHLVCTEREYSNIYIKQNLAIADLFLYQVYKGLELDNLKNIGIWFPTCYIYTEDKSFPWEKLCSKSFCEKIMVIFNAKTIEEFKIKISKCIRDREVGYSGSFNYATAILDLIDLKDIATLP